MEPQIDLTRSAEVEICAAAGYDAVRRFALAIGEADYPTWENAPDWQKKSNRMQAAFALRGATAKEAHSFWVTERSADGWTRGPKRDSAAKTHPAMCAFENLPPEQQAKNEVFLGVVKALAKVLWKIPA
jgi:hypothetical protein